MLYRIQDDNSIIYPTDLYLGYHLYLIDKVSNSKLEEIGVKDVILDALNLLFKENTDKKFESYSPLNIMEWEDTLGKFYDIIKIQTDSDGFKMDLMSIKTYYRKIKLEKLDGIN